MNAEVKEEEIKISEEKDGSLTVELPDSMLAEEPEQEAAPKAEAAPAEDDDADHPDDTDAVREARRARRKAKKEYIKRVQNEKDERLAAQDREIQEMREQMAAFKREIEAKRLAELKKAMEDEEARIKYAKIRLKEATDKADGTALVGAQEAMMAAKDRYDQLAAMKAQQEQQAQVYQAAESPMVQKYAKRWMEKNSWYDPEGGDPKSRMAKQIDAQLAREGFNPATQTYWQELSARVETELQDEESDAYTDSTYETPRKRGPKSVVTGSERETGGGGSRNTFTLSVEQVRAMKEAGFWDDPKMKAKMVARYAREAAQRK
jgi:hypothetical protein